MNDLKPLHEARVYIDKKIGVVSTQLAEITNQLNGLLSVVLDSGVCGPNVTWTLYASGLLKISGTGSAYDYVKGLNIGRTRQQIEDMVAAGTLPDYYGFEADGVYDVANEQWVAPWYKYRAETDFITPENPDGYVTLEDYNTYNPKGWRYNRIQVDPGITYIGNWFFYRVCGPTELVIPEGVTELGIWCIRFSTTLDTVTLPDSLTTIGYRGVSRDEVLTTLNIGDGLVSAGDYAFAQNPYLTELIFPDTLTTLGELWCEEDASLQNVRLGSITTLPDRSLLSKAYLTNVILPDTLTTIEEYAFYNCSALSQINIPANVTTIDANAFTGCTALHTVYIDSPTVAAGISVIGSYGNVVGNARYIYIHKDIATIGAYLSNYYYKGELIGDYYKHTLWAYAEEFEAAGMLGSTAHYELSETETPGEFALAIKGSGAISGTYSTMPWYSYKASIVSVDAQSGITSLPASCFSEYPTLRTAALHVTTLPNNVCYKCAALSSLDLSGVTYIGNQNFWQCTSLTSVIIPSSVSSTGTYCFYQCAGLNSLTIQNGITTIGADAFNGCMALQSVTIPNSVVTISARAFAGCNGVTSVVLGTGVTTIGLQAFNGNSGTLTIPETNVIETIGNEAFILTTGQVGTLYLPAIVSIGDKALRRNLAFTTVDIGSGITTIGAEAFRYSNATLFIIRRAQVDVTIGTNAFAATPPEKLTFVPA